MTDPRATALLDTATKQALLEVRGKDPVTWSHVTGSIEWDDGAVQRFGRPDEISFYHGDIYLRWKVRRPTKARIILVEVMGFRSHVDMLYDPGNPEHGEMWVDQRIAIS